jgi:hypothetical protein
MTDLFMVMSFKLLYTEHVINYTVCLNWNLSQLIEKIKYETKRRFNFINDDYERYFCIIPNDERGEPLENSNEITILEKFRNTVHNIVFYIRVNPPSQNTIQENGTFINNDVGNSYRLIMTQDNIIIRLYQNYLTCCICLEERNNYIGVIVVAITYCLLLVPLQNFPRYCGQILRR